MKVKKFVNTLMKQKECALAMKHYSGIIVNGRLMCASINTYGCHAECASLNKFFNSLTRRKDRL